MPMLGKVTSLLRRLKRQSEGNIAIMFGLSAIPLVIAVGMAIDISRGYTVRTRLNAALDDAGLALGSSPASWTNTQLQQRLTAFVQANYPGAALGTLGTPTFAVTNNGNTITVTGTASVPTTLMQLVNVNTLAVSATSVITKGLQGLELAIVLDNTGSMMCGDGTPPGYSPCTTPGHIPPLIAATHDQLVMPLLNQNSDPTKLKISFVPYVTTVNAGPALAEKGLITSAFRVNGAGNYLDINGAVINDYAGLPITYDATQTETTPEWKGCVIEPTSKTEDNTSPPAGLDVSEPAGGWTTPWIALYWHPNNVSIGGSGYNNWWTNATTSGDTQPIFYGQGQGQLFTYWGRQSQGPNNGCPTKMLRLKQMDATNQTALLNATNGLRAWAAGGTMIHEGMIWGWRTLSPNPPFADGVSYSIASVANPQWIKAVVLETDGINESINGQLTGFSFQSDGYLGGSNQVAHLNNRLQAVCDNMKAQNIRIYTVGFGIEAQTNTVLQQCAGNGGKYIAANNSAELATAFTQISSELNTLRLSK